MAAPGESDGKAYQKRMLAPGSAEGRGAHAVPRGEGGVLVLAGEVFSSLGGIDCERSGVTVRVLAFPLKYESRLESVKQN